MLNNLMNPVFHKLALGTWGWEGGREGLRITGGQLMHLPLNNPPIPPLQSPPKWGVMGKGAPSLHPKVHSAEGPEEESSSS